MNPSNPPAAAPATAPTGHPRGLRTLFLTEMWERFSYYAMRALLILFMADTVERGGLGLSVKMAAAIYGLYTAGVYLAALPGGWVADRFLGAQRSVWYGGLIITAGQFTLAFAPGDAFYLGLVLVVLGTGLLKPNVSAIVGELYPEGGARRDAGFTIFYMGINLGALVGPLISAYLAQKWNWRWGFGAAGVGMILGLIQFKWTACQLGAAGLHPGRKGPPATRDFGLLGVGLGGLALVVGLAFLGVLRLNPIVLAQGTTYAIVSVAVLYFATAFLFFGLDATEKKRLAVIAVLFVSSAVFWSGFEQAGSSLNIFADRFTQRVFFGREIPAGWFQALGPNFIIVLAPVVAWVWVLLARRGWEPSLPAKFGWGLLLLAAGFLVMAVASTGIAEARKVLPLWLVATYFLHSVGELCLSPVGLSSVTKLAPKRMVGQMMGLWFLATSLGNLIAGLVAGNMEAGAEGQLAGLYLQIVYTSAAAGLVLLALAKPIQRLMAGVR